MKIDAIDVYRVGMPLIYPFRTAYGNDDRIETILVKLSSDEGYGWGEATAWQSPGYCPECAKTAFIVVRDFLAPRLVGEDVISGEDLQRRLAHVKGNYFAKAALDLAWWDLEARRRGQPLYRLLGGQRKGVDVGADFGIMESIDLLLAAIAKAVDAGFKRVKLKYRPGWDLDMVAAVRQAFPNLVAHIDCNSAYTLDAAPMFKKLDAYGLAMIEQPLMHDDLIDHATLQRQIRTPICLDESITSPDRARKAIATKACGWINIKPPRMGGMTPALAVHNLCREAGMPCWVGSMLESALGARQCLALATLPNFVYPADFFPTDRFYHEDLSDPRTVLDGPGYAENREVPGCGAEPNMGRLAQQTLEHVRLPG
jgi:O-succinylbenzoate synthase